jgi:hypothetical protein
MKELCISEALKRIYDCNVRMGDTGCMQLAGTMWFRLGYQNRRQVKPPIMSDMSDEGEGIEACHGLQSRREEPSVLCWYQHGVLNAAIANCCFQTLVHIGIEANNGLLPSGCVQVGCVDIGATKRAVRKHMASTRVPLQQYAVLSSKFSRDTNDQRQGFCLFGMHKEASSIPFA